MLDEDVLSIQAHYPQVYFACHVRHVRAATSPVGLSPRDSALLAHLHEERPARASSLARHLGVRPSTLSAALKRLEALGYVVRTADPEDRRRAELRLGPRGVRAMQASSVLDETRVRRVLRRLSAADRKIAVRGLELLADAASAETAACGRRAR